jgi:hypothetical protein
VVTGANGFVRSHRLEALARCEGIVSLSACCDRRKRLPSSSGEARKGNLRDQNYPLLCTCWVAQKV